VVMLSKPQQIQNTLEKFEARLAAHDDLLDRITDRVFPEEL